MNGQGQDPTGQPPAWPPQAGQAPPTAQPEQAQPMQPGQPMQPQPPANWPPQGSEQMQAPQIPQGMPPGMAPGAVPMDPAAGMAPAPPMGQPGAALQPPMGAPMGPMGAPPMPQAGPVAPGGAQMLQQAAQQAAPTGDAQSVVESFGTDERGKLVRLPDNYQPVQIDVVSLKPSSRAGTPELEFIATVLAGPYKGIEITRNDSRIWFTLPKVATADPLKQGRNAGFAKTKLAGWNSFCVALTGQGGNPGQACDGNALVQYAFQLSGDPNRSASEIADQYNNLDSAAQCAFIRQYLRMDQWNGKQAMAYIRLRNEPVQQLNQANGQYEPVMDPDPATGQLVPRTRQRNELSNLWPLSHDRYGLAVWERNTLPAVEQQYAAQHEQRLV